MSIETREKTCESTLPSYLYYGYMLLGQYYMHKKLLPVTAELPFLMLLGQLDINFGLALVE